MTQYDEVRRHIQNYRRQVEDRILQPIPDTTIYYMVSNGISDVLKNNLVSDMRIRRLVNGALV